MTRTLTSVLNDGQRLALANVRAAAERIWRVPLHRYYTQHGPAHSERVVALLDGLTAGMMATPQRLSPGEAFVLLAATWLHDVGMQDERFAGGDLEQIRAAHHQVTAELIYRAAQDPAQAFRLGLPDDPGLVEAVALVAKGHRRADLAAAEYEPLIHGGETLRLRLLAALLRFGDELDIDHRRVDLELIRVMRLPVESQFHWWKCHYVSGVSIEDETIRIAYRFPHERPDYEGLIVPLVETDVRGRLSELEETFRAHAVKVAVARSQVRWMRAVQVLPPEVEAYARSQLGRPPAGPLREPEDSRARPPAPATPAFDQGGQVVRTQIHVTGDYTDRRPTHAVSPASTFEELHAALTARYDLEELRTLCAAFAVPFDDLRGEGLSARARELILWLQRRGRLDELRARLAAEG